jgi:hypothetical protein
MIKKRKGKAMKKQNIIRSVLAAELVLVVPLMAMLFSVGGWDWKPFDFVIAGILLAGVGVGYQMIATGVKSNSRLAAIGIVLAAAMILTWIELAVGIFGTPFAGQ